MWESSSDFEGLLPDDIARAMYSARRTISHDLAR
jgi:hypothetical protein